MCLIILLYCVRGLLRGEGGVPILMKANRTVEATAATTSNFNFLRGIMLYTNCIEGF